MAGKFYAVKNGRKNGIYRNWDECKAQINGFSGAVYKSFKTEAEAVEYMADGIEIDTCRCEAGSRDIQKENNGCSDAGRDIIDMPVAYVDGSYYNGRFSYGMVILYDGQEICDGKEIYDSELAQMHNVAGEIKGSEAAMRYALEHGFSEITIFHDYEGIARWCLGEWKANKEGTRAYKAFYDSIKDKLKVNFVKVKGHSGDKYNDLADTLAKKALGL